MSEQNRFFQWLYRILALAALGLLVLIAWTLIGSSFEASRWRNRDAVDVQQAAQGKPIVQRLHFSDLRSIEGSSSMFIEVHSEPPSGRGKGFSSGGYGPGALRNLVFFDGGYERAHWLLDRNDEILLKAVQLHDSNDDRKPTLAIFLELIRIDSNKDGVVDEDDTAIPAMVRADGSGLTELSGIG